MTKSSLLQSVQDYWDANVAHWKIATHPVGSEEFFRETERYRFAKLDYMLKRVDYNGYKNKKLLDVGCGLGNDLARFVSGGAICTGIDLSPKAVALAQQNFQHRGLKADFFQMNGEEMSFPDNSFDVIYCHTVLHFTPNPERMIQEIVRVLKPGGTAILMTINRHSWLYVLHLIAKVKIDYLDAPVFNKYTYNEFRAMLAPFEKVNISVERFPVRTEVHEGIKAKIYNTFFVDFFNSLPEGCIGKSGYHLLACAHKHS